MEFEVFYADVHERLVATLVAFCGDADLGRDAADEAIVRAYERWSTVQGMDSPIGWVFRTGCNVVRRRVRRREHLARLIRGLHVPAPAPGPATEIWQVVAELPARQRQAVVLRHVADLTEPDIATAMGIARGTVSSLLRNAYASLRLELGPDIPTEEVPS